MTQMEEKGREGYKRLTNSISIVKSQKSKNVTSHTIADLSLDDEAKYFPLCENCRNHTSSLCATSVCNKNENGRN